MSGYEIVFCDLDGTLINTLSGKDFPEGIWDMKFNFPFLMALKHHLKPKVIGIVTNQGGIPRYVDKHNLEVKMEYICRCIDEYCKPEYPTIFSYAELANPHLRKPETGMLTLILSSVNSLYYKITDKSKMVMVGDASGKEGNFSDNDKKCAENFGIDYLDVSEFISNYTPIGD